jgi:hypothetical protein
MSEVRLARSHCGQYGADPTARRLIDEWPVCVLTEGFQPTLSKLTAVLDRLRIRYHLTGGIATIAYGEPRMTQDVDLVLDGERVLAVEDEFLDALTRAGFHFSEPTARQAIVSAAAVSASTSIKSSSSICTCGVHSGGRSIGTNRDLPRGRVACRVPCRRRSFQLVCVRHGSHRSRRDLRRILPGATRDELRAVERTASEMGLADQLAEVLDEPDEIGV